MGWFDRFTRNKIGKPLAQRPQLWLETPVEHEDDDEWPRRCTATKADGSRCKNHCALGYVACTPHRGKTLPPPRRVK